MCFQQYNYLYYGYYPFREKQQRLQKKLSESKKGCQHMDFPSGPPPQYQPCLKPLNFGVRMGSGALGLVWPTAQALPQQSIHTSRVVPHHFKFFNNKIQMQTYQYFINEDYEQTNANIKTEQIAPWDDCNTNIITSHSKARKKNRIGTQYEPIKQSIQKKNSLCLIKQQEKKFYMNYIKRKQALLSNINSPKQICAQPKVMILEDINVNKFNRVPLISKNTVSKEWMVSDNSLRKKSEHVEQKENSRKQRISNDQCQNYPREISKISFKKSNNESEWLKQYLQKKNGEKQHKIREELLFLPEVTKRLQQKYSFNINHKIRLLPL